MLSYDDTKAITGILTPLTGMAKLLVMEDEANGDPVDPEIDLALHELDVVNTTLKICLRAMKEYPDRAEEMIKTLQSDTLIAADTIALVLEECDAGDQIQKISDKLKK